MGVRTYIVELILPADLRACRPDFKGPFVATEPSPEDPPTTCREELLHYFPWLCPGTFGVREIHIGEFEFAARETQLSVLVLGNEFFPNRIPVDGERIILRRPSGEIFNSDVHMTYFVGDNGIEPIEGEVALRVVHSTDVIEIGANLREFLWYPITEILEEYIRQSTGSGWFQKHEQSIYSSEAEVLHDMDLSTLTTGELEAIGAKIIDDIESLYARSKSIEAPHHA